MSDKRFKFTVGKEGLAGDRRRREHTYNVSSLDALMQMSEGKTTTDMFDESPAGIKGRKPGDRRTGPEDRRGTDRRQPAKEDAGPV